jgi:hypothetical protein
MSCTVFPLNRGLRANRNHKLLAGWLLSIALLFLPAVPVPAQVGSASLSGLVQDKTGAIIPYATVTLQNSASGARRTVHSSGDGSFTFSAVSSGDYSVSVERTGFDKLVHTGIHVNPGDSLSLSDLRLEVGAVSQTVSVADETAGLPLDSGQLSSTISAAGMPRSSKNFCRDSPSAISVPPTRLRTSPRLRSAHRRPTPLTELRLRALR